jgi:acetyl esterase/lipase
MISARSLAICFLLLPTLPTRAADPQVIPLWPAKPPGDVGIPATEEKFIQLMVAGKPYEVAGRPTRWLTNVTKPTITIYPAPSQTNTHVAMIICPGGGYHNLGWDIEGEEVAAWLNSVGITGVLLKYRCPRRPGDVKNEPPLGPLIDAQRALRLTRAHAAEWSIDPRKIGIIGFSAGGHLAGAAATNFDKHLYDPIDDADKQSCRPDFSIMLYSGYFKPNPDKEDLSPTIGHPQNIPPLFLVHATDDTVSAVENSITMYQAMKKLNADVELHLYATGGHGFAVRKVNHPCEHWPEPCLTWLHDHKFLDAR